MPALDAEQRNAGIAADSPEAAGISDGPPVVSAIGEQLRALQLALEARAEPGADLREAVEAFLDSVAPKLDCRIEAAPRLAFLKARDGRYVFVNGEWERRFGRRREDWYGKEDSDFWPRRTACLLRSTDRRVLNERCVCQAILALPAEKTPKQWLVTEFPVAISGQEREFIGGVAVCIELNPPDSVLSAESVRSTTRSRDYRSLFDTTEQMHGVETIWLTANGEIHTRENARIVKSASGETVYYEGVVEDLTQLRRFELRERDRNRILERIAMNEPLSAILADLCGLVEQQLTGTLCAFMAVQGGALNAHTTGKVPEGFRDAFQAIEIGSNTCSPALVAKFGEAIVSGNIALHSSWAGLRSKALALNLQSCTSVPVLADDAIAMGTLDVYRPAPYAPDCQEIEFLEAVARLAAIAMDCRKRLDGVEAKQRSIDPVTGLPSRVAFESELDAAIEKAARQHSMLAVLWLDLDRFTGINDNLGHRTGDILLRLVAQRLEETVPRRATVARTGGDEFAVLLPDLVCAQESTGTADSIVAAFRKPFQVGGADVVSTCSVGTCIYPVDGLDAQSLLRNADSAMCRAKAFGKDTSERYEHRPGLNRRGRLELEQEMRKACERHEFQLYYQPQADRDGRIDAVEALIRWRHPKYGLLSPAEFLPVAEETGLIHAIGEWVLQEACSELVRWRKAGACSLRMAVNVSASQVYRSDLPGIIRSAVKSTAIPPDLLELELTENVLIRDLHDAANKIAAIRALGVSIAIDDFGTGYSSLNYLHQLPVDTLKIDRSFLAGIDSHAGATLIRTIATLANELDLRLIAEGVETEEQLRKVFAVGVRHVQGYLISRPVPATELHQLLAMPPALYGEQSQDGSRHCRV